MAKLREMVSVSLSSRGAQALKLAAAADDRMVSTMGRKIIMEYLERKGFIEKAEQTSSDACKDDQESVEENVEE